MTKRHYVTLCGSLRKGSLNRALAGALPALAPKGVTISALGSVGELPHYDFDVQDKGFPHSVTAMAAAIRAADGVIIVTPEYNYSMSGVLKNALDWLSRLPEQPFSGKPVAIQSASPGLFGGARAQYQLRQVLHCLNAKVLNRPEIMVGQAQGKIALDPPSITDEVTRGLVVAQLEAFNAFV